MLKERVITALIIAPILIAMILWLPFLYVKFFFGGLILLGAWEWAKLAGLKKNTQRIMFLLVMSLALYLSDLSYERYSLIYEVGAVAWWSAIAIIVVTFKNESKLYNQYLFLSLLIGLLTLALAWLCLVNLHGVDINGPYYLLYVCCLVSAADVGAYFTGRRFGRRKLSAKLSPGKTIEGVVGGLLSVLLLAGLAMLFFDFKQLPFILLSLFVAVFAVIGDLFESLVKRVAGVKDSGSLLPGHGGILDRIDSAVAAVPIFFVGSRWFL